MRRNYLPSKLLEQDLDCKVPQWDKVLRNAAVLEISRALSPQRSMARRIYLSLRVQEDGCGRRSWSCGTPENRASGRDYGCGLKEDGMGRGGIEDG